MIQRFIALFLTLLFASPVQAQIIGALPYTLTNGQVADANQVMANFNAIVNSTNANAAGAGVNTNITALNGLSTPITAAQGGSSLYIGGTSSNVGNAYTLTSPIPTGFGLSTGRAICFTANAANTAGGTTLNVGGTGATNFYKQTPIGPAVMTGGELQANQVACAYFDGTQFQCTTCTQQGLVPSGTVLDFSGPVIPSGYLQANGTQVSRTTYPALFNAVSYTSVSATTNATTTVTITNASTFLQVGWYIGGNNVTCNSYITAVAANSITINAAAGASGATTLTIGPYQQGDCSTTFHLPNLTGKVAAGVDGSTNITNATFCNNPSSIGDKIVTPNAICGNQQTTLVTANLPPYTPAGTLTANTTTWDGTVINVNGTSPTLVGPDANHMAHASAFTGTAQGGTSTAFSKLPPMSLVYKIIKT